MDGARSTSTWEALAVRVGEEIGISDWIEVSQSRIDAFADITGDHYFLHLDSERARALSFPGTIAHGFLTLALLSLMSYQVCPFIEGARHPLNYGFNRLRFVAPVPAGSRIRGRFVLVAAETISPKQRQLIYDATVEIDGATKPALVAEWLTRVMM